MPWLRVYLRRPLPRRHCQWVNDMRVLRLLCSISVAAVCLFMQTVVPVYTDFGNVKQIEIGTTKCLTWFKLAGTYDREMACYAGGKLDTIAVTVPGGDLLMEFRLNSDLIVMLAYTDPSDGLSKYQIVATPAGGTSLVKEGTIQ